MWLYILGGIILVVLALMGYLLIRARSASIIGKQILSIESGPPGPRLVLWHNGRQIPLHPDDDIFEKRVLGQTIASVLHPKGAGYQTIVLDNGRQLRLAPGVFLEEGIISRLKQRIVSWA